MTDAKGNFKGEDLALDAIVVALISVAVAFLAFGLSQLDSLQAYKPYIFVSAGLVFFGIQSFSELEFLNIKRILRDVAYATL